MRIVTVVALVSVALAVGGMPAAGALCQGDCNGDGVVEVHELLRGVGLSLDTQPYRLCPPIDASGDGDVGIDDLIAAVGRALNDCPPTAMLSRAPALHDPAGPLGGGRGVLPNGRRVEATGAQLPLDTFPLNIAFVPGGRYLLLTNDGWGNEEGARGLQLVDLELGGVHRVEVPHTFGLAVAPDGTRVFVADGDSNSIYALRFEDGALEREAGALARLPNGTFPSSLAISPDGATLYVVGLTDNSFRSIDIASGAVRTANVPVGNFPYAVLLSADGRRAFVSSWGVNNNNPPSEIFAPLPPLDPNAESRSSIAEVDLSDPAAPRLVGYTPIARSLSIDMREIFGGSHPSAMALSPDGQLLYITASNLDLLVVLDAATRALVAEIPLNVFDATPLRTQRQGFYPNALAIRADSRRVYVANAGINAVQVIDVDPQARTFVTRGFLPTGWYPSALGLSPEGTLYVANGKGEGIGPNGAELIDVNVESTNDTPYYIGRLVKGSLSVIEEVDGEDLEAGTAAVRSLNGLDPVPVRWVDGPPAAPDEVQRRGVVPIAFGSGPSEQIKYVVFILKENRTYDQVFGSFPGGNGDPSLELFGEAITPNHWALARRFGMGDNFYCDAEVSITGHEWTDQGNSTDFTEKLWPRNYNGSLSQFVLQFGQEGFAKGGYIFEAAQRAGIPYRVYGETFHYLTRFATGIDSGGTASLYPIILDAFGGTLGGVLGGLANLLNGDIAALERAGVKVDVLREQVWPDIMLDYPANIIASRTDRERAELFLSELAQFEANGAMPNYVHIWLPNDHTFGARPNTPDPTSAVADNDDGLGRIIEGLSHSRFWPNMAVFVSEDDAQDGQDHVSAHRTISLVASPWAKRGYISPVHHSNVSMLKTMELLLGLPPLSQYDALATDMRDYFTTTPDYTPFTAEPRLVEARLNPTAEEAPNAYLRRAAVMSEDLNLEMFDSAGENLSQVLRLVDHGRRLEAQRARRRTGLLVALGCLGLPALGILIGRRRMRQL